ncbi:MAG: iron-containing alcohol dehydrogenase [Desulfitobacteriaceae bacterium]
MNDFTFQSRTKIVFGRGVENHVGQEVKEYLGQGGRLLLHYGGGSVKQSGLYVRIVNSLKTEGIDFLELGGVKPNPRLILVEEGIKLCRAEGIKFILAVGGGSVIDSAKAIAIGVPYEGKVWDFYERKATLPVGVVLTIAAAGSEASNSSVITNEDGWLKRGIGAEITRPRFALMNPELTFTLPPHQTAAGVADIMAHIMERYFTQVTNVDLTDRLCEATPFEWPERTAWEGIERLIEFFRTIGLPVTLTELDVPEDRLEEMAAKCTHSGPVGNFMKLNKKDVLEILRLARS